MMCKSNAPHSISREIVWLHTHTIHKRHRNNFWGTDGSMSERRMARHRETIATEKKPEDVEGKRIEKKHNTHEWKELQIEEWRG